MDEDNFENGSDVADMLNFISPEELDISGISSSWMFEQNQPHHQSFPNQQQPPVPFLQSYVKTENTGIVPPNISFGNGSDFPQMMDVQKKSDFQFPSTKGTTSDNWEAQNPPFAQSSKTSQVLSQTSCIIDEERVRSIGILQRQSLISGETMSLYSLKQQIEYLKKMTEYGLQTLDSLEENCLLLPHEIYSIFELRQSLKVQLAQLNIYYDELNQAASKQPKDYSRLISLVIVKQPPPIVLLRGRALEETIEVQILSGSNVDFPYISEVKVVTMMTDKTQLKSTKDLDCESKEVDQFKKAKFPIKFLNGTRKTIATLKFGVQVQVSGHMTPLTFESEHSNGYVVITNESQYEESDGLLLKVAFEKKNSISWVLLANRLQQHFIIGTRQNQKTPKRCLTIFELDYLHKAFFGGQNFISSKMFDEFWNWFSSAFHKLRHERNLSSMWQTGLIYGFLSKEMVSRVLSNKPQGTFLLRFSENHSGSFAVGYVSEGQVRHYLIRDDEVGKKGSQLAQFLNSEKIITHILQVKYDTMSGIVSTRLIEKNVALESYLPKKDKNAASKQLEGYERQLKQSIVHIKVSLSIGIFYAIFK